ncbi:hypothetical protein M409DRAFT_27935 [Zasmidium cellare ATCC 36951]|uniref:Uncharacterized protein n=1 Tax=Zasmidium cellare ATCC 36951 TaxID=1080233 RepID=A0A6A6C329_ZASCE|nr:uncharacterized protein M409DRAFT_27935 [Zasmidium cellare ATCC 36951]KAF2161537.1 hypothetical protein M409DRAFT_27935 [Zasmidium cellare ATCC 36951]
MPEEAKKEQESLKDKILHPGKHEEGKASSTGEKKGESKLGKFEEFVKEDAKKEANDDIWGSEIK